MGLIKYDRKRFLLSHSIVVFGECSGWLRSGRVDKEAVEVSSRDDSGGVTQSVHKSDDHRLNRNVAFEFTRTRGCHKVIT